MFTASPQYPALEWQVLLQVNAHRECFQQSVCASAFLERPLRLHCCHCTIIFLHYGSTYFERAAGVVIFDATNASAEF